MGLLETKPSIERVEPCPVCGEPLEQIANDQPFISTARVGVALVTDERVQCANRHSFAVLDVDGQRELALVE